VSEERCFKFLLNCHFIKISQLLAQNVHTRCCFLKSELNRLNSTSKTCSEEREKKAIREEKVDTKFFYISSSRSVLLIFFLLFCQ
jgi:hypothetical protein